MNPDQHHTFTLLLTEIRDILEYLCKEIERLGKVIERSNARSDG